MHKHKSKNNSKGQTTVPPEVRKALNLRAGDEMWWDIEPSGRVTVRRVSRLSEIAGILRKYAKKAPPGVDIMELEERAVRQAVKKRWIEKEKHVG